MKDEARWLCDGLRESIAVKQRILEDTDLIERIVMVANRLADVARAGGRLIFAGNGGSAADAQHLATEFVSRFRIDRRGLPALSLATDTSLITAIANDYGFDQLFARQLSAQARAGDAFIGLTTSGRSPNVLLALSEARRLGLLSIVLCGSGGEVESLADLVIRVPSADTARIQEAHITIGHLVCEYVERVLFGTDRHQGQGHAK